jgi:hypothetical protein
MDSYEWFVLTLLRFIIPLSILRWPLAGVLASIAADVVLSDPVPVPDGSAPEYQAWDKVLDTYYLGLAAYVSRTWSDPSARAVSLLSFGYRAVGVVLFLATGTRYLLFLFPNFFENFFIFYLVFRKFSDDERLFTSDRFALAVFLSLLIPKLAQEFFMHAAFVRPRELVDAPEWLDLVFPVEPVVVLQWIVYLGLPAIVLMWRVGVHRRVGEAVIDRFTGR